MTTLIGGGVDPAFLDDIVLKEGSFAKWEERVKGESPMQWFDEWDPSEPDFTFTADADDWRVHYKARYPLAFYHQKKFVFGVSKPSTRVSIDQQAPDILWARIDGDVVVERSDFPRFSTRDRVEFSHTPMVTERPNVFRLGNGYSLACSKFVKPLQFGAETDGKAWWMVGPTSEEEALSHRVMMIKIYDGPFKYQSRGTDILLSDPAPLSSESEYVIYSYDEQGMRGLYREVYQGVKPQKNAMTMRGDELNHQMRDSDGLIRFRNDQITGPGIVRYVFPLEATKLLKLDLRGSEVSYRMNPDDTGWVTMDNYDGRAVNELEIEFNVVNSLASFRLEWESLKDWAPVGRPKVDILPAGWGGNLIRLELEDGEGLTQTNSLYTGAYTVSANVKCIEGLALIDVGGIEVLNWTPLDKSVRGSGDFVANNDLYDFTLMGREKTIYEIDRFRVAEAGKRDWVPQDLNWYVETESGKYPASASINNPEIPVAIGEAKSWRIGVDVPKNLGETQEVAVSAIYNEPFKTGASHIIRQIRWSGEGKSRIYYPQNVINLPFVGEFIPADGRGAITWEQNISSDVGDVRLLLDGSPVAYTSEFTYRPVTIQNRRWRVVVSETTAMVYLDNRMVGFMVGQGLPFRIIQDNPEDVQLDCSVGFIQMRRELGPRFEGWQLGNSRLSTFREGSRISWGVNAEEARDNMPFYVVRVAR